MDGDWILEAQVTLNNSAMEESLIEMFGCVNFEETVIRIYVSNDRKQIRKDVCIGDKVVDSQTTLLPSLFEPQWAITGQAAGGARLATA